jgi:hypothetical protein
VIIIEGPRNVGKTFLLSHLNKNVHQLKFVEFKEHFNLDKNLALGFSYGKDIAQLQLAKEGYLNNLIMDRGFLSSIVYSIILGRDSKDNLQKYFDYILDNGLLENSKIIYIHGKNPVRRVNKDFLDDLEYDVQEKLYTEFISRMIPSKHLEILENKFDDSLINTFVDIINKEVVCAGS